MSAGTALSVRLLVYAGLSLFIINGPYVFMVVCVVYAYNLTKRPRPMYNMEGALQEQFSVMGLMKKLTIETLYPSFHLGDLVT